MATDGAGRRSARRTQSDSQLSLDKKAEIEAKLHEVNELVISSHSSFEQVQDGLRRVQSVVPLAAGEAVSIKAVPGRMFDMLSKAQVQLGTTTGAKIPLSRHGEGFPSARAGELMQGSADGLLHALLHKWDIVRYDSLARYRMATPHIDKRAIT